ncbi:MAG: hypothetical protein ACREIQ_06725, partial [Nitrospiria bacterium]
MSNPDGGLSLPEEFLITPPVNYPSLVIPTNTQLGCSDPLAYQNLTVISGAILTLTCEQAPLTVNGTLLVESPSQIVVNPRVEIQAGEAIIRSGAKIQADEKGCTADLGYDTSSGQCSSLAPGHGTNGGGGGYGGFGGNSGERPPSIDPLRVPGPGGASYAESNARTPVELGSGGGSTGTGASKVFGGVGGGDLRLEVIGTLTLDGVISSSGQSVTAVANFGAGGGSGGSIYVTTGSLKGSGSFVAAGGAGGGCSGSSITRFSGGGGAGGRIGVNLSGLSSFSGGFNAAGGQAGSQGSGCGAGKPGKPGTLFFSDPGSNTALILGGDVRLPFDQAFTSLTIPQNMTLVLSDGVNLTLNNSTSFEGTIKVSGSAKIKALGNFTVPKLPDGTSASISANEGGCAGGTGFDVATRQCTTSAIGKGNNGSGGGYGGEGGSSGGGVRGGRTYGSANAPVEPGSGGGSTTQGPGGSGGGAIGLEVMGTLTMDGVISSNGQSGTTADDFGAGGGSGGSISVTAGRIMGGGSFVAPGGSGGGCLTSGITN